MSRYVTNMDLPWTFESIENAPNQEEAIKAYLSLNLIMRRFLDWYTSSDYSKLSEELDYKQATSSFTTLAKQLPELEYMKNLSDKKKKVVLERVLSAVDSKAMMFFENALTKNLKEYYPSINWELFEKIYGDKI